MRWRTYNDIIDKLCAWFLYQQLYQELDANGIDYPIQIQNVSWNICNNSVYRQHRALRVHRKTSGRKDHNDTWNKFMSRIPGKSY